MNRDEYKMVQALVDAVQMAINHLAACEAGRIRHPFLGSSGPRLVAALALAKTFGFEPEKW